MFESRIRCSLTVFSKLLNHFSHFSLETLSHRFLSILTLKTLLISGCRLRNRVVQCLPRCGTFPAADRDSLMYSAISKRRDGRAGTPKRWSRNTQSTRTFSSLVFNVRRLAAISPMGFRPAARCLTVEGGTSNALAAAVKDG